MKNQMREDLKTLLAAGETPRLSIALAADPTTTRAQGEYRNLLRAIETQAHAGDALAPLLARARALAHDAAFWQQPGRGVAIYIEAQAQRTYHLPYAVTERALVGPDYLLTPLLPLLAADQPCAILALSQGAVKLLRGTRTAISEVSLPASVPTSLEAALRSDEYERERRYSAVPTPTGRQRGAIYYSHGIGSDEHEGELRRYCQQIDAGVCEVLTPATTPLILAGGKELTGIYRSVASYPNVLAQGIDGNPDVLSAAALGERARPLMAALENADRQASIARFRALIGTGRASTDPGDIVRAAGEGRVDTLIVAAALATTVQPDRAVAPEEAQANRALLDTLRNRGAVVEAEPGEFPGDQAIVAIYRY
ncbi:MAG: hypothetical protein U0232_03125 [Thermomicrobiales bacterium]